MKRANRILTILIFIFLYIPMAVLIVASFNSGKDITQFEGFTWDQYAELFRDEALLSLLGNSVLIALLSTAISIGLGTMAAVGIHSLKPKMRSLVMSLTNIPMTNPDIVTGVSLSLLFVFVGSGLLGQRESLNFWTLLIAHVTFGLPYVILNVMPKLQQMDNSLTDAAMDLGCTPLQAFFKVTIHEIMPGIVAGGIMAFTMSLDDFVISYFVTGSGFVTLPVEIYTYTKKPIPPKIYAMFTLLFLLIAVLMVGMNLMQLRAEKKKMDTRPTSKGWQIAKRCIAGVLAVALVVGCGFLIFSGNRDQVVINVYNWGMNIADGTDETLDIIAAFEEKTGIKVNYSTYESNEVLYSKLKNGGISVDVIIPSDYMIDRMIAEDMLEELDFGNIPNFSYVDEQFKNPDYDPENKYSVPYTWGTLGILYNTKYVAEEDVTGWELMWNEKYAGKILMIDNSRDAFGIAEFLRADMAGEEPDVNSTDPKKLQDCADLLAQQRPLVQQYVMDQIYSTMENEEAYIAAYYAGDCMLMMEENPDLAYYLPEHQGFNLFTDAMCIPKGSQEKAAAEAFINFLCDPEISGANMDYICYASPISQAKEYMEDYLAESEIVYPDAEVLEKGSAYAYLSEETSRLVESLYQKATKTSESVDSSGTPSATPYIIIGVVFVGLAGVLMFTGKKRKKK
ncbi:MAG: extracellular solute-binding protein [Ruminococcaceae bacterium]|nr:extracellular solute-binding protein [Oscillospiraceae bacterium]